MGDVLTLSPRLFGGHISRRAEDLSLHRHRDLAGRSLGQTEIHDVWFVVRVDHDIAGFDVPVNDAGLVRVLDGAGDLGDQFRGFVLMRLMIRKPFSEVGSSH